MISAATEQEFLLKFKEAGDREYDKTTLEEFLTTKIQIRSNGKYEPYSFKGHECFRSMTRKFSNSKKLIAMKAAQIGFSTWMIGRALWLTNGKNLNGGFYFPDRESMKAFVQYRWDPIIKHSPYFQKMVTEESEVNNVRIKNIGKSLFSFNGTTNLKDVKSFDADITIRDEVDEQNPENSGFISDRLLHSNFAKDMAGSQPSIEDFGIHAEFMDSDQNFYLIKCDSCNHWNDLVNRFLEDPEKVFGKKNKTKEVEYFYACEKCHKPLNNQKGEYVAKRKHKNTGVQISQMFLNYKTPTEIYQLWKNANSHIKRKNLYISVIGWPYSTDEEKPVTQSVIDSQKGDHGLYDISQSYSYMGADQGDTVHMVFGEPTTDARIRIIGLAKFSVLDDDSIHRSIIRFAVYQGIVDAMPNKSWSVRLAKIFPEQIKIQYFSKKYSLKEEDVLNSEDEIEVLNINRDESLQDTVDAIKNGLFIFPDKSRLDGPDLVLMEEFEYHLKMLIRERGEDEFGRPKYSFKKKVENHFGMALNSMRLAYELSGGIGGAGTLPVY
ncbi:MAG: phage terminase large subunit family protein [Leptospiraceae bacterium]|nr:phage terminase large subunit family protein [Leptospiraceae bacterium]NUM41336.1 phage terminase large subunit family protein [Leptospiraceae bacterium]